MLYSLPELLLSVMLATYLAVCVVAGVVRWGHRCPPYVKHMDYYFPAWRTLIYCAFSHLVLLPVVFLPGEPDAVMQLRMMLMLTSPFFCEVMIFSYFGRVLGANWWRRPVYVMSVTYVLMSMTGLVVTLLPGTQLQGTFLRWYFLVGGVLALSYLVGLVLALRMILRALRNFSEENYSNPDDFPKQYAESILWIPLLHLIMSWSMTFNGAWWALCFGLLILSILAIVLLLGALSPHRAMDVERLEADLKEEATDKPAESELLPPERKEAILQAIRKRMEEGEAYLDSHLTLSKLSQDCGINRTYVSSVLSERLGGFFTYVNRCRLAYAETYKQQNPRADVDEVALASGFNSRQSLYNARKRLG